MTKYYITTAIDYLNGKPHLGHAYEKVVADALARWHKLLGDDVFFLTGSDEHGQKVERAAMKNGLTPKQWVDTLVLSFKELCSVLNADYSRFIRTTDSDHVKVAQTLFKKIVDNGDIYLGNYEGLYCIGCEAFYLEKDAPNNECPIHNRKLELVKEESYFFKLSKYQDRVLQLLETTDFVQPAFRRNEFIQRVKEGLKDLSVSRTTFKWGIPVPINPEHVIYVWIDALPNYLTGVGYPGPQFKKYWPADVHIIGKDIAWFHVVIWPALLMSLDIPLPKIVHTHGHLTLGGEKMSKTTGIVVDPMQLVQLYGADAVRYFFLREVPAGQDGDFSEEALVARANGDLADGLGNLLQRVSVLLQKNFEGKIPEPAEFTEADNKLITQSNILKEMDALMQKHEWNKAVEKLWLFVRDCNQYVNEQAPWKLTDKKRVGTVLYCLVESLRIISILSHPFIPGSAEKIAEQLGQEKPTLLKHAEFRKTTTGKLSEPKILFKKLEVAKQDKFSKVNLKVAEVLDVQQHPNADKLYVLQVDLGEKRQLCAGIKQFYSPEELKGKRIIVVSNLKPAKLRGVESQGMLLAAEKDGVVKVLEAPLSKPGQQVFVDGVTAGNAQITIDDFTEIVITTKDKVAVYNGKQLKTEVEVVKVDIGDDAKVK